MNGNAWQCVDRIAEITLSVIKIKKYIYNEEDISISSFFIDDTDDENGNGLWQNQFNFHHDNDADENTQVFSMRQKVKTTHSVPEIIRI